MPPNRDDAYALATPADHRRYYDSWSATYDRDFADATGYLPPAEVAATFRTLATAADSPVVDVGCGTGVLGRLLSLPALDGLDISPGMLAGARRTGAYRDLRAVDLTDECADVQASYGGIVSSGTFTRGHLGPRELSLVLRLGRPGALCVIGINAEHLAAADFAAEFARLRHDGRVGPVTMREMSSYPDPALAAQPGNRTAVTVFRLTD